MKLIVILPTGLHSMMVRLASIHSGRVVGWSLLLITGMVLLPACRDSFGDHPPVYPVNGKVVVDGKPMNGGTILFECVGAGDGAPKGPEGAPFRVTGKINNEGVFRLVAYPGKEGMPAGEYKVGIVPLKGRSDGNLLDRKPSPAKKGKAATAPMQYADPKTSGLTAQVLKDGPNEPLFELKLR
jgi:hypothetical protein